MTPTRQGSIRLFRFAGISVYLHWSWFVLAVIYYQSRGAYSSPVWSVIELLTLFSIVLLHEFGHSLACRQVGGHADEIVLWPFGGVAYVDPPPRPGATLWSIAAGPLVNVLLLCLGLSVLLAGNLLGVLQVESRVGEYVVVFCVTNLVLLLFNLLPIYPLDGGQILRSVLWFFIGPARSLMVASIVGIVGAGLAIIAGLLARSVVGQFMDPAWMMIMAAFVLYNCWEGLGHARAMLRIAKAVPNAGFACPGCGTPPPQGAFWGCGKCRKLFDTFETGGRCPNCDTQYVATRCFQCGGMFPFEQWGAVKPVSEPPPLPQPPPYIS